MEKDQNNNSENQNNEAEELKSDDPSNNTQPDISENNELSNEITPEEKIKELEDMRSLYINAY